jgi:peptidoglycan/LPS O-acetylase OafA/YrhL
MLAPIGTFGLIWNIATASEEPAVTPDPHTRCNQRLTELDGLRGLAALSVFGSHVMDAFPQTKLSNALQFSPLGIIWDGQSAVILFFVLSGFVLALSFAQYKAAISHPLFYIRFVFQRAFRIYPAYWFALIFSIAAMSVFIPSGVTQASDWAQSLWRHGIADVTPSQLVRHLLLIVSFKYNLIDPPSWTLLVEIRMSLLMPFLVAAFRILGKPCQMAVLLLLSGLGLLVHQFYYLPMFALGVALARHWPAVRNMAAKIPRAIFWSGLAVAIATYGNKDILRLQPGIAASEYAAALGAALLISLAVSDNILSALLNSRPVQFMGRVSYSFYLLHLPIFLILVSWMLPVVDSILLVFPVALATSCFASYLSFTWIEQPAIRFSHQLANHRVSSVEQEN